MKSWFSRLSALLCTFLLLLSCLLVSPSPAWAKQMSDGGGGGPVSGSGGGGGRNKDEGSFVSHAHNVFIDFVKGAMSGAAAGAVTTKTPAGTATGAIAGGVAGAVDGCTGGCHNTGGSSHGKWRE
jgi:hypothetical protein